MVPDATELLEQIASAKPVNEAEVETKIVLHLLRLLGYSDSDRADKVTVRMRFGREVLEKIADFILYNGAERSLPNALLCIENKRIGESLLGADEQVRSYATWAGTPFTMACNGEKIMVAQFLPGAGVINSTTVRVADLPTEFERIRRMIGRAEAVLAKERISYITTYLPEVENLPAAEFFREYLSRLSQRFSSLRTDVFPLAPPSLRNSQHLQIPVHVQSLKRDPRKYTVSEFTDLLADRGQYLFVEGPPGSGKSTFCRRVVSELAERCLNASLNIPVPLYLDLSRGIPASISAAFHFACEDLGVRVFPELFKRSLEASKVLLLLDGLDELPGSPFTIPDLVNLIDVDEVTGAMITTRPGCPNRTTKKKQFVQFTVRPLSDEEIQSVLSQYLLDPRKAEVILRSVEQGRIPDIRSAMTALMAIRVANELPEWDQLSTFELYKHYVGALHTYFNATTVRGSVDVGSVSLDDLLIVLSDAAFVCAESQQSGYAVSLGELSSRLITKHGASATALLNCGLLSSKNERSVFVHRTFQEFGIAFRLIRDFRLRGSGGLNHPYITDDAYRIAASTLTSADEPILVEAISNKDKHIRKRVSNLLLYTSISSEVSDAILQQLPSEPSIKVWAKLIFILIRSGTSGFRLWLQKSIPNFTRPQLRKLSVALGTSEDVFNLRLMLDSFHEQPYPEFIQAALRIAMKGDDETYIPELVRAYSQLALGARTSLTGTMASHPGRLKSLIAWSLLPIESSLMPLISILSCIDVEKFVGEDDLTNATTQKIIAQSGGQVLKAKARRRLRRVIKRIETLTPPSTTLLLLRDACSQASGID